jgi:hypothetical protein
VRKREPSERTSRRSRVRPTQRGFFDIFNAAPDAD